MEKQYYMLENAGLLDVREIYKMGVTSKTDSDDNIGQFGTGLKSGVLSFKREGLDIIFYIDKSEINFNLEQEEIRGKTYSTLFVDGVNTHLTTEMNKLTWKAHDGVREIVCNALDEGISSQGITSVLEGREGHTRVYMEYTGPVEEYFVNYNDNHCERKHVLFESKYEGKVFMKHSNRLCVYRKGVRVNKAPHLNSQSVFDYELRNLTIGEDRVNHSEWEQSRRAWELLGEMDNVIHINKLIEALSDENKPWEWKEADNISQNGGIKWSKQWQEALAGYTMVPKRFERMVEGMAYKNIIVVPNKFYDNITNKFPRLSFAEAGVTNGHIFAYKEFNNEQSDILLDVKKEMSEKGYKTDCVIRSVTFDDHHMKAAVYQQQMLIGDEFFTFSREKQRKIFFEEIMHVDTGHRDGSRALQNVFINEWHRFAFPDEIV